MFSIELGVAYVWKSGWPRKTYTAMAVQAIVGATALIQTYPAQVQQCMQLGAFTVSIKVARGHSVALNEAHEMCINS